MTCPTCGATIDESREDDTIPTTRRSGGDGRRKTVGEKVVARCDNCGWTAEAKL